MAITSFTTLKAAVEDYLDRTDIPGPITDAIMFGENRIYRDVRVADMEKALSATTSSGVITAFFTRHLFLLECPLCRKRID